MHLELGREEEARTDFDKAIELDPEYKEAYYNCSHAHSEMGRHVESIKDCRAAARLGLEETQQILQRNGISW